MQSGKIFLLDSNEDDIQGFRKQEPLGEQTRFDELERALDIVQEYELSDGRTAYYGEAAAEELGEQPDVRIRDDGISNRTKEVKQGRYTELLFLPDSFLAISSSSGGFAVGDIRTYTPAIVTSANVNLDRFIEEKSAEADHFDPWKIGFYGNLGSAENGVFHGSNLLEDDEVGGLLDVTDKNQLGVDIEFNSRELRLFAAESGYVEIYQPSNLATDDFIEFIDSEIVPYLQPE